MNSNFYFGNASEAVFIYWFLLGVSLLIGWLCTVIMQRLSRGREKLERLFSKRGNLLLLGLSVTVVVLTAANRGRVDGFYSLAMESDAVHLAYVLPDRSHKVLLRDVQAIRVQVATKGLWQFVLLCRDGSEITSAPASEQEVLAATSALRASLARGRTTK